MLQYNTRGTSGWEDGEHVTWCSLSEAQVLYLYRDAA